MNIDQTSFNNFAAFATFANRAGNADDVAKFEDKGLGKDWNVKDIGHGINCGITRNKSDKPYAFMRTADDKRANNLARDIFRSAVTPSCWAHELRRCGRISRNCNERLQVVRIFSILAP